MILAGAAVTAQWPDDIKQVLAAVAAGNAMATAIFAAAPKACAAAAARWGELYDPADAAVQAAVQPAWTNLTAGWVGLDTSGSFLRLEPHAGRRVLLNGVLDYRDLALLALDAALQLRRLALMAGGGLLACASSTSTSSPGTTHPGEQQEGRYTANWMDFYGVDARADYAAGVSLDGQGGVYVAGVAFAVYNASGEFPTDDIHLFLANYGADGTRRWVASRGTAFTRRSKGRKRRRKKKKKKNKKKKKRRRKRR